MASSNRLWKFAGLASLVGVVATGALLARSERERRSYTPDEVRERLRQRYEAARGAPVPRLADGPHPAAGLGGAPTTPLRPGAV